MIAAVAAALALNLLERNRARIFRRIRGHRDAPWMRPQEEHVIRELLRKLDPKRCLEWGAGVSMLQFPALLGTGATWLSVEHDRAWADRLRPLNVRPNVELAHVPADQEGWAGDGDEKAFASYLGFARTRGLFDFILIDGRARSAALEASKNLLAPGGVVVLHDANRAGYAEACRGFAHQLLFRDSRVKSRRPAGGIWVGSLDRQLGSVLDIPLHRRIWAFYRGLGRVIA